jgi:hypothetical protein
MTPSPDPKAPIDIQRLIAEVAAQNGVFLKRDDPAIALVTMNRLILDAAVAAVHAEIRGTIAEFHGSMQKAEKRAGGMLAQCFKESATQLRQGLQNDIHLAGLKAREIVHQVNEVNRRQALVRWAAAGLISAVLLFGGGYWCGTLMRRGTCACFPTLSPALDACQRLLDGPLHVIALAALIAFVR